MKSKKLYIFLSIVLLTCIAFCKSTTASLKQPAVVKGDYNSIKSYITQFAEQKMKENEITGLSIALVNKEGIIWTINSGYADLENKIPVTSDTLFLIGSTSKVFTATAIMQLAEQGKLDIDKPIQTYIPEFSMKTRWPDAKPITIRSIMTHTSGIPLDYFPVYSPEYSYFADLVKDIKDEYVAYPPGFITAYSNLANALLGVVIERVSGQKFNDYMTEHIFKPLGMKYSSYEVRDDMKPMISKGYRKNKEAEDTHLGIWPPGSIHSSVNEMSHFIQMVLNNGIYTENRIIKKKTLQEMSTPQTNLPLDLDTKGQFGLNWVLSENANWGKFMWHNGGSLLFVSYLYVLKEHNIGVVVLTNSANAGGANFQIANEAINKSLLVKNGPVRAGNKNPDLIKNKIALTPIEGTYYTNYFGLINFKKEGQDLSFNVPYSSTIKYKLISQTDQWYTVKEIPSGNLQGFQVGAADIDGKKVMLSNRNGHTTLFGEKLDIVSISPEWQKRCGKYKAVDKSMFIFFQEVELKISHGIIEIIQKDSFKNTGYLSATPISDNELLIRGLGRGVGDIIRVINVNGEERLVYKGVELVKK